MSDVSGCAAGRLHRQPQHLLNFLFAELGTSGSVDGTNQLIIKGRFQQKQIETVLRRYIRVRGALRCTACPMKIRFFVT